MRIKVLPYVTVDVDDRVRTKLRSSAERMRLNVRAYLLSAADDVDTAGNRVRGRFAAAVDRVDDAVGRVTDRLGVDHAEARDDSDVRREAG